MDKNKSYISVVVVNDDPSQLVVLGGFLNHAGMEVRAFEQVEDALNAMDSGAPPNLIVTDLYMPGIDGWRFCRLLRSPEYAAFNDIPILVVSATFAGDHPERIAADVGADAYLAAPVDGNEFVALARALLEGNETRRLPRALIVEDSETLAGLLKKTFTASGYRAETVFTVGEAEAAVAGTAYDVAVLDYHLPDGKGDTLLDTFRNQRPQCVCLMMTTDPSPKLGLDWMKRGAAAYLRKPFEPELLIELCARARRERSLLRAQDLLEVRTRDLRESEAQYRALLTYLPTGIVIHALDTAVLYANAEALRLIGLTREQMLSRSVTDPVWCFLREDGTPMPVEEYPVNRVLATRKAFSGLVVGVRVPGRSESNWGLCNAYPHFDVNGQLEKVVVSFNDITERKHSEKERERLQAQLAQMQKMDSIGRLAGGVAHDFNNMLSVILGHTELVMGNMGADHPLQADLEEIQKAARRSADLTRQLLAFARKQAVAPRTLDLNNMVTGMHTMLGRLIGEHIQVSWKPGHDLWSVRLDPSQVDQILVNLCVNARDAITGGGTIAIETENIVITEECCAQNADYVAGEYVRLTVSDDGCGLDAGTVDHLFEPFFTTKETGQGTGLGLATVYGIVKQNNGFVSVYSEPGKGAAFSIYLPRYADAPEQGQDAMTPHTALAALGGETVLLAEDEPAIVRITTKMLESLGYTVISACTPDEAIRQAVDHTGRIDVLMTDVVMPGMNGRDMASKLVSHYPDIKRLFMSGYTADIIAHQGVLDEGVHYIQKPFSAIELAAKLRETLSGQV